MAEMTDVDDQSGKVAEAKKALGGFLRATFLRYKADRQQVEDQWSRNQRQMNGVYDASANIPKGRSRAYPRVTRVKALSVLARVHAMMFPAGEANWDVEASPRPTLPGDVLTKLVTDWLAANQGKSAMQEMMDDLVRKEASIRVSRMRTVIADQLADAGMHTSVDYAQLARDVIYDGIVYSPGILKGPMTLSDEKAIIRVVNGVPKVIEGDVFYRPYLEHVRPWDWYPDMSAQTLAEMDGSFERHVYTKQTFEALAERDDFDAAAIAEFIKQHKDGNYTPSTLDHERAASGRRCDQVQTGTKFEVMEYWGSVERKKLEACGVTVPGEADTVTATVWLADEKIIKLAVSPYPHGASIYHTFIFERDDSSPLGAGLPMVIRDSQLMVANFARMLVDNAGSVCGPMLEVDRARLDDDAAVPNIEPFATFYTDSDKNVTGVSGRAINELKFDAHINPLLSAIRMANEFADTESFVGQMTGGQFESAGGEALRTNSNFSAALQSAALPYKDIVRNFDAFTKSLISRMIDWNLIFHEDRDDLRGDVRPVPKGASSLMAKEQRAMAITTATSSMSEEELDWIDTEKLVREKMQALDMPASLLRTQKEVDEIRARRAEQQARAEQQQQQLFDAELTTKKTEALKDLTQAQKNSDMADAALFRELVNAIQTGADIEHIRQLATQAQQAVGGGAPGQPGNPAAGPAGTGGGQAAVLQEVGRGQ